MAGLRLNVGLYPWNRCSSMSAASSARRASRCTMVYFVRTASCPSSAFLPSLRTTRSDTGCDPLPGAAHKRPPDNHEERSFGIKPAFRPSIASKRTGTDMGLAMKGALLNPSGRFTLS
jgi:hypothetical protein